MSIAEWQETAPRGIHIFLHFRQTCLQMLSRDSEKLKSDFALSSKSIVLLPNSFAQLLNGFALMSTGFALMSTA